MSLRNIVVIMTDYKMDIPESRFTSKSHIFSVAMHLLLIIALFYINDNFLNQSYNFYRKYCKKFKFSILFTFVFKTDVDLCLMRWILTANSLTYRFKHFSDVIKISSTNIVFKPRFQPIKKQDLAFDKTFCTSSSE